MCGIAKICFSQAKDAMDNEIFQAQQPLLPYLIFQG
jgi:hypothetical protein